MNPANKIWINGKIASFKKSGLFCFNQALNYGASIYEGIRFYNTDSGPAIFRLEGHLKRFFYSASALRMKLGFNKIDLEHAIKSLIRANRLSSGYIRPLSFYSELKMGINILNSKVSTIILVWPWRETKQPKTVRIKVVKYKRLNPNSIDMKAKISGYYVNGLLGFIEAREGGFDEPLFLDHNNFIAEGAVNNIFLVKNKILYTPRAENILAGITRDTILRVSEDLGFKNVEKDIRLEFLKDVDEVFLTGTGIELEMVKEIGDFFYNKNNQWPVTDRILKYYQDIVHGRINKYKNWLTYL